MTPRRLVLVLACLAGAALTACGDAGAVVAPEAPQPGVLTLTLTTPFPDDRAVLVSVAGPEVGAVSVAGEGYTVHSRAGETGFRAAVFGKLSSGPLLTFAVPDVNRASAYTATLQEVVDPASEVRASTAGYVLTVAR